MTILVLAAATLFLAWSNGANDDFEDDHVSARPGDRHRLDPPRFGAALLFGEELPKAFGGKGVVADAVAADPRSWRPCSWRPGSGCRCRRRTR